MEAVTSYVTVSANPASEGLMSSRAIVATVFLVVSFCAISWAQSPSLPTEFDPDIQPEVTFHAQVRALFNQEDFRQLDQLADTTLTQKQRLLGGGWKLKAFYTALRDPGSFTATDDAWNAHFDRLERWISASPDSSAPRVALAESQIRFAWKARGNGPGSKVTAESWSLFNERIDAAFATLLEASSTSANDPEWYHQMVTIALAQGWKREGVDSLVRRASEVEPEYFYTYNQFANYLLPKWHGHPGDSEDYIKSVADRIGGAEGDFVYFRLAMDLNCCGGPGQMHNLSWDRVKVGFAALERLYGATNLQRNGFAYMAVRQGDKETAQELFQRIGENWDENVWASEDRFESSKANLTVAPLPRID